MGARKPKGLNRDRQNLGARKPKGLNRDRQNLGARKPKGLNRIANIWEQENQWA